jgi:hypothetical protein
MVRDSVFKGLIIVVVVVCLSLVFVGLFLSGVFEGGLVVSDGVFSECDFLLEVDLSGRVFNVGDSLSGTAAITNVSGKNAQVFSSMYMPCTCLHNISETNMHPEFDIARNRVILRADDKISRGFVYELTESGMYVLYVHYYVEVNGVGLSGELEDIVIEVK